MVKVLTIPRHIGSAADIAALQQALKDAADAEEDAQVIEGAFSRFLHRVWKAI